MHPRKASTSVPPRDVRETENPGTQMSGGDLPNVMVSQMNFATIL